MNFSPSGPRRQQISKAGVSISKWVNEAYPPWDEILSAHDVARLTRCHRWVLSAMAALRRFPRKRRFHGRAVGWHRADVVRWLANHHSGPTAPRRPSTLPLPLPLPGGALTRRNLDPRHGSGRTVRRRRIQSIKRPVPHPASRTTDDGAGRKSAMNACAHRIDASIQS